MADHIQQMFCLLFWYDNERNWSIQNCSTIVKPRRDPEEYKTGDLVVAKFQGKIYKTAIVGVAENKDHLKDKSLKLDTLLKDTTLTASAIMTKLDIQIPGEMDHDIVHENPVVPVQSGKKRISSDSAETKPKKEKKLEENKIKDEKKKKLLAAIDASKILAQRIIDSSVVATAVTTTPSITTSDVTSPVIKTPVVKTPVVKTPIVINPASNLPPQAKNLKENKLKDEKKKVQMSPIETPKIMARRIIDSSVIATAVTTTPSITTPAINTPVNTPMITNPAINLRTQANQLPTRNSPSLLLEEVPEFTLPDNWMDCLHEANNTLNYYNHNNDTPIHDLHLACRKKIQELEKKVEFLEGNLLSDFLSKLTDSAAASQKNHTEQRQRNYLEQHQGNYPEQQQTATGASARTPRDMEISKENVSHLKDSQMVELVPGYGVHLTINQLNACVRKARGSGTALTRLLLVVFFDTKTLADSCARGTSAGRMALSSKIIDAIIQYALQFSDKVSEKDLIQAVNGKCSDVRQEMLKRIK